MNDHNYTNLEEVRECRTLYPFSTSRKSQWQSHANTTMSSCDYDGSSSSSSSNTTDVGTTRHFRVSNNSEYYCYDAGEDSNRSSRPSTPPGLHKSKGAIPAPQTPEPVFRTTSSFPGLTESPIPLPVSSPRLSSFHSEPEICSSSKIRDGKRSGEENPEYSVCLADAVTWEIAPDVHEKVQSALARVLAMDQAGAGGEWNCHSHGSQPVQKHSVQTVAENRLEEYRCYCGDKPPKSPLSPEELERAIRIIEELSVVNGVSPDVFVQSGISPGTLYHAFKHLARTLKRGD